MFRMTGGPCSDLTEHKTEAGQKQVDSVLITSMLGAHTLSEFMDFVSQMLNFWHEDAEHFIITTFTPICDVANVGFPLMHNTWDNQTFTFLRQ